MLHFRSRNIVGSAGQLKADAYRVAYALPDCIQHFRRPRSPPSRLLGHSHCVRLCCGLLIGFHARSDRLDNWLLWPHRFQGFRLSRAQPGATDQGQTQARGDEEDSEHGAAA